MMDANAIRIQSVPYTLNDVAMKMPKNYVKDNGITYYNADALTLSEVLGGALVLSPADKLAALASRRAEKAARKAREERFAAAHDWEKITARKFRMPKAIKADILKAMETEIEMQLRNGRKYLGAKKMAKHYGVTYGQALYHIKKVQTRMGV